MGNRKTKVKIPENLIDYYAVYTLDRKLSAKEIKKSLRSIQGDICENMSSGSLNSDENMAKLQTAFNMVADALKIFKDEEKKKKYDIQLDEAYRQGILKTEEQKMAEDLYAEIEAMFLKGNYRGAAKQCNDALNNNIHDAKIYGLLARSYYALREVDRSLRTVADGVKIHPEDMELLKIGARFYNEGKNDYNAAQNYINQMLSLDEDNKFANAEQIYLYLCSGKSELAYQNMDEYIEKHPCDNEFRRTCAYDLIGYSYHYYTKDPNSGSYVLISKEAYENCVEVCSKAASVYSDDTIKECLEYARNFGKIEFNEDNKENILWLAIAGVMYFTSGLFSYIGCITEFYREGFFAALGVFLFSSLVVALGVGVLYSAVQLRSVSYRPYWQIYKYYLTGEREKKEKFYIKIGKIFADYMKWGWKVAVEICKYAFFHF